METVRKHSLAAHRRSAAALNGNDSAVIIPLRGKSLLIELQYRPKINKYILELPAGHIEPGEKPEHAAERELEEETGYSASNMKYIARAYSSPGNLSEMLYFYLATGLRKGKPRREPGEKISIKWVSLSKAVTMIRQGKIVDAKTIAGILFFGAFCAGLKARCIKH
ncbi:MAG: NUDIX hydrolase [Candidatus Micrarchaeaceae archaeon]